MGVEDSRPATSRAATFRALVIGLILLPINVYWVLAAEVKWYVVLTLNPLFVTPIFYLFTLVGLNAFLRRFRPRWVFAPSELLVIYLMLVMSCTIATHDYIINLMSTMGWASWFATPENEWETLIFPHLPKWLYVWDKKALEGFFYGNRDFTDPAILKAWLAPLSFWSIFILSCGWMFLCLSVIVRRAWMDETRLSFPIIRLPVALITSQNPDSMVRTRAMWYGFAIPIIIGIMNGLHEWYPLLPHIQTRATYFHFPLPPWTAAGTLAACWYPFGIGLAFLVPLDISFSCWFFYLFYKLQAVAGYQMGFGNTPDMPFVHEQQIGAWYAFGISLLYLYRRPLLTAFKKGLQKPDPADADEPMSYRAALIGLLCGILIFTVFWAQTGMSLIWVLIILFSFLLLSLSITRVRAEAGGQHNVWDQEPMNLMRLFDSRMLGPANLAIAAAHHWYWRLHRSHAMPSQFEAFKMAQETGVKMRDLVMPMMLALVVSTFVSMWACLDIFYSSGAQSNAKGFAVWTGMEQFGWLESSMRQGFEPEPQRWAAVFSGAGVVVGLYALRTALPWFPFHPLGYCMGAELRWLWLPFFVGWLLKWILMRFGGLRTYQKSIPFFLGLILGDYFIGALWSLIGLLFDVPVMQIFH